MTPGASPRRRCCPRGLTQADPCLSPRIPSPWSCWPGCPKKLRASPAHASRPCWPGSQPILMPRRSLLLCKQGLWQPGPFPPLRQPGPPPSLGSGVPPNPVEAPRNVLLCPNSPNQHTYHPLCACRLCWPTLWPQAWTPWLPTAFLRASFQPPSPMATAWGLTMPFAAS